ncbi:lysine decarboxylase [Keratinibaculum paraultunense]|uniref:Lysine decarboxylase n=1 Tax=Keratinibaculum paraultunense TaxID=1278232 RepID=A0A4V2UU22_9FIRM|nr:aminotransferase class I/II-fold pyridoxal phosphate-dependent enzyme [Keratinibaculum paraultunense]QQY79868.1 aminotransferase class V-fold PLP-dependent enzyme [Keratinibaculum paraultunense]TCS88753.1 lysine decarboxylase [Keratinibaculum paraultunense]
MNTPILDALKKLKKQNSISFHTPGHKGKNTLINWEDYIPFIDTTEIWGMDNLQDPKGIIKESQELAAKAFGAKYTLYSINGTTGGIYIALSTITNPGDKILIQRNSHKSVYNAALLNRLDIEYIYPKYNEANHIFTGINPEDVEANLKKCEDIKVVVITYPNYYGICSNIERIAEIVHKYDKLLLVDEAHGSHFVFSKKLPISALEAGADIVVQSTHKTLVSFTQSSMVHVGTDRVDIDKLMNMSSIYQSTSPSYILMLSLEIARAYMEREGIYKLEEAIYLAQDTSNKLKAIEGVNVFTEDEEDTTIYDKDPMKILFKLNGITGADLSKRLMEIYHIYLEMSDYYYALALTTLMNSKDDFKRLIKAMEELAEEKYTEIQPININMPKPNILVPIYEAFYSDKKAVNLKESIGKISASYIIPYPPGIPLICPGEQITEEIYYYILQLMDIGIEIVGFIGYNKEKILVID